MLGWRQRDSLFDLADAVQSFPQHKETMSEIAELLQQKVGLSANQAQSAESVVLEFIRARVPEQFQGVVNSILGGVPAAGEQAESSGLGSLLGAAEGLLGGHNS